jgi:hypothetical protein
MGTPLGIQGPFADQIAGRIYLIIIHFVIHPIRLRRDLESKYILKWLAVKSSTTGGKNKTAV